MSGGLAPSKSTVYVSNLPYELTNNDLHKIFEKYGKLAKVTIVKDKLTRESKGVAFVLFVDRQSAHKAVHAMNRKELFGRTLKCSIARDNGRASEFIRKRYYSDKTRCYECGEFGHLSFRCPKNTLGDRPQPEKKKKKVHPDKGEGGGGGIGAHGGKARDEEEMEEDEYEDDDLSLGEAIRLCHDMREREVGSMSSGSASFAGVSSDWAATPGYLQHLDEHGKRKTIKPDSYFSDEDATD